jgi:hypothetical protein
MSYESLPESIKAKCLRCFNAAGEPTPLASLIPPSGLLYDTKLFNVNNDYSREELELEYYRLYEPIIYRAKLDEKYGSKEKRASDAAEKVDEKDWSHPVIYDDHWFYGVDEFRDWWIENYIFTDEELLEIEARKDEGNSNIHEEIALRNIPAYIWACKKYEVERPDVDMVINKMFPDLDSLEDFQPDIRGVKELGDSLEQFYQLNKEQNFWVIDGKKVVILDK